jgi:PDZ domain-containing secreted protein
VAGTGFYFVDVHEIEANKLEELWGRYLVHGATLVPVHELVLPGESQKEQAHQDIQAMDTSQVVAEAVAEQALGKPVTIRHLGALVEQVTPGLPAAKAGVQDGEVITAVNGEKVRSATDLIHLTGGLHPGDGASFTITHLGTVHMITVRSTDGRNRASSPIEYAVNRAAMSARTTASGVLPPARTSRMAGEDRSAPATIAAAAAASCSASGNMVGDRIFLKGSILFRG